MDAKVESGNEVTMMLAASVAALLLLSLLLAAFPRMAKKGNITMAIANCRQIILAYRMYAADHGGKYPDAAVPTAISSNEVFRELFVGKSLEDEMIFGCPLSPFAPDGNVGPPPKSPKAVEAGENHWACTIGLNDSSPGSIPLIFENPAVAEWPPRWNADVTGKAVKGRTWSGGRIIIGTNDTSVELQKLEAASGPAVTLRPGANLFEDARRSKPDLSLSILDAATK